MSVTLRRSTGAVAVVLLLGSLGWAPRPAVAEISNPSLSAGASGIYLDHLPGNEGHASGDGSWGNGGGQGSTTTTTTTTTTSLPSLPTTTTSPTTTTPPGVTQTTTVSPTTTTTIPTTTTTRADVVGLITGSDLPRGPSPEQVPADGDSGSNLAPLVSLGAGFVGMAVEGLGYYLLVFLVPVFAAIWLSVIQRREEQVASGA